jgi:hypothetical protein
VDVVRICSSGRRRRSFVAIRIAGSDIGAASPLPPLAIPLAAAEMSREYATV